MVRQSIQKIRQNSFLNASLFSGLSAISKLVSSVVIAKFVAVLLGPEGLALIGQLNNFILLIITLGGTAFSQGIVKYIAQYSREDPQKVNAIISTGLKLVVFLSVLLGIGLILGSTVLSSYILFDDKYYVVFICLGFTLLLSGLNAVYSSVLNGMKEFKKFNLITILSNLFGLIVSVLFMYFGKIEGALIGLVLNQTILFLVTYWFIRNESWFGFSNYWKIPLEKKYTRDLFNYAVLALFSTILVPIVSICIRNFIIEDWGMKNAGYYELIVRISSVSLMFFSVVISTYYIPRISEIKTVQELKKEVRSTYKIIIPISILALGGLFLFRELVIKILATTDFLVITQVFIWQTLADFFKILAQILSFILVARAFIKLAILIEIAFNSLQLLLCYFYVPIYGYEGAIKVNTAMYVVYFLTFVLVYYYYIIPRFNSNTIKFKKV
ncbi:O-antigen translocase [Myroides sp. C15-4]|uniref:O-antigen translocase n=1 Tax=Myroides sp. C15-4 TaxID=3400532 RepID=UPI003D2F9796